MSKNSRQVGEDQGAKHGPVELSVRSIPEVNNLWFTWNSIVAVATGGMYLVFQLTPSVSAIACKKDKAKD